MMPGNQDVHSSELSPEEYQEVIDGHHQRKLRQLLPRLYGFEETLFESYNLAKQVAELPGDIVECGIAMGAQLCAMKLGAPKKLTWGFDSFEGIQLAGKHDEYQPGVENGGKKLDPNRPLPGNLLVSSGITVHNKRSVENNILEWGFPLDEIRLVEGWVQNTLPLPQNQPEKIAILRLDMDIHDATKCAMEHLWPKLVNGGILIIDDWGYAGVRKAVDDYLDSINYHFRTWNTPKHTGWLVKFQ